MSVCSLFSIHVFQLKPVYSYTSLSEPNKKGREQHFLFFVLLSSESFWMHCFHLSLSSSLNKTFVRGYEQRILFLVLLHICYLLLVSKTVVCPIVPSFVWWLLLVVYFFPHSIYVIIKEIPSKKLRWILTAVALHSASNPPVMSTASSCSRTDGLRVFMVYGTGFPIPRWLIMFQ